MSELPNEFKGHSVFALKIECDFLAYSRFDFAQFFEQTDGTKTKAVISLIDGFMCISGNAPDITELKQFISVTAPSGILCESELAKSLGLCGKQILIMERTSDNNFEHHGFEFDLSASEVYSCLSEYAPNELDLPDRNAFVSDFSFKQRRGLAAAAVNKGNSVAAAFSLGDNEAYIGAVGVPADKRGLGYGAKAVEALIGHLQKRMVYLFCEECTAGFYLKLGFKIKGQATIFKSIGE